MSEIATKALAPQPQKKVKKLKPARKQVKPGDVVKTEAVQTGKEYSAYSYPCSNNRDKVLIVFLDIWYNKWAGGDREDSYSKYALSVMNPASSFD